MNTTRGAIFAGLLTAASGLAQSDNFHYRVPEPGEPAGMVAGATGPVYFTRSDGGSPAVVKGAPYNAEAVSESTQTLPDGNRITHNDRTTLARDSEGRTRRDITMPLLPGMSAADTPRFSFIHDPVTNTSYTLNHNNLTATKSAGRSFNIQVKSPDVLKGDGPQTMILDRSEVITGNGGGIATAKLRVPVAPATQGQTRTDSLGTQTIEGVRAEGTRTTTTIPAGQIGNERPIEVVSERWYSPELQTVVLTKFSDPRQGDSTYKLTNIRRTEPDKSLFEVPATYTIQDAPAGPDHFIMRRLGPPPEKE